MAPIHDAARMGCVLELAKMLDVFGVESIHLQHHQTQWTPLMIASSRGHVEAAHLLIEHGADINFVAKGYTALYLAVREGCTGAVALLLERGADPSIKTNVGWSCLMMAANRGHLAIVRMLLEHPAVDVNDTSNGGRTALWLACRWGHREVARVLLTEGGADYTLATRESDGFGDASSKTCKDVAWEHGYEELVAVIEDVEKAYLLHKARALHDDAVRRHRFPGLPPPHYLVHRVQAQAPLPALEVLQPLVEEAKQWADAQRVVSYVSQVLQRELFRELEAYLGGPGSTTHH